jgi:hypothetical protein
MKLNTTHVSARDSRSARLVRSGIAAFGRAVAPESATAAHDLQTSTTNALRQLSQRLDAIHQDGIATRREKQGDSQRAIEEARQLLKRLESKADTAKAMLRAHVGSADDVVHAIEARQNPMQLRRLEQRAMQLETLTAKILEKVFQQAIDAGDVDTILAYSLMPGHANTGRRALAAIGAPNQLKRGLDAGAATHAGVAALHAAQDGLERLAADPDCYADDRLATPADLFACGEQGAEMLGFDPQRHRDLQASWMTYPVPVRVVDLGRPLPSTLQAASASDTSGLPQ